MEVNGFEHGRVSVGSLAVDVLVEWQGAVGPIAELFPSLGDEHSGDVTAFGEPYVDEHSNYIATAQTHVIRSHGATILIDTGIGNHKQRPGFPIFGGLDTDYVGQLHRLGVKPEDVDIVVNTHCHLDHTGWNTRLENGEWVPTFPNAQFLMCEDEFDFWNPENPYTRHGAETNQNVWQDSIEPILRAGQIRQWTDEYTIDSALKLVKTPGHTPGSASLLIESDGEKGLFIGDMLHTPIQLGHPHVAWCFDEDSQAAAKTRLETLHWAADENMILFPAHFTGGTRIERRGSAFRMGDRTNADNKRTTTDNE